MQKAGNRFPLIFVAFQTEANVYSQAVNHANGGQIRYRSRAWRQRKRRSPGFAWKPNLEVWLPLPTRFPSLGHIPHVYKITHAQSQNRQKYTGTESLFHGISFVSAPTFMEFHTLMNGAPSSSESIAHLSNIQESPPRNGTHI